MALTSPRPAHALDRGAVGPMQTTSHRDPTCRRLQRPRIARAPRSCDRRASSGSRLLFPTHRSSPTNAILTDKGTSTDQQHLAGLRVEAIEVTPRPAGHPQTVVGDRHRRVVWLRWRWQPFDSVGRGVDPEDRASPAAQTVVPSVTTAIVPGAPGASMAAAGSTEVMAGPSFGVAVATAIDGVVDEEVGPGSEPAGECPAGEAQPARSTTMSSGRQRSHDRTAGRRRAKRRCDPIDMPKPLSRARAPGPRRIGLAICPARRVATVTGRRAAGVSRLPRAARCLPLGRGSMGCNAVGYVRHLTYSW